MSTNNPKTLATARFKQDAIKSATAPEVARELAVFVYGWIEALLAEGLIDHATWETLRAETDAKLGQRLAWLEGVATYGEPAD
ncbi:hypothetical protein [Geopseudomonas aromaticivorans]